MARKSIEAYGGDYESLVELSTEFGVDYQEMGILIRKGLTPEEAIERCRSQQQKKEDALYIINNTAYQSLAEACRGLGVSPGSVYARRKKLIGTMELPEEEVIRVTQEVLNQLASEQIKHRSRGSSGVSVGVFFRMCMFPPYRCVPGRDPGGYPVSCLEERSERKRSRIQLFAIIFIITCLFASLDLLYADCFDSISALTTGRLAENSCDRYMICRCRPSNFRSTTQKNPPAQLGRGYGNNQGAMSDSLSSSGGVRRFNSRTRAGCDAGWSSW